MARFLGPTKLRVSLHLMFVYRPIHGRSFARTTFQTVSTRSSRKLRGYLYSLSCRESKFYGVEKIAPNERTTSVAITTITSNPTTHQGRPRGRTSSSSRRSSSRSRSARSLRSFSAPSSSLSTLNSRFMPSSSIPDNLYPIRTREEPQSTSTGPGLPHRSSDLSSRPYSPNFLGNEGQQPCCCYSSILVTSRTLSAYPLSSMPCTVIRLPT